MLNFLWAKVSFRHLSFAAGLHAFVSYGASTWNAPFFTRIHNMSRRISGPRSHWSPVSVPSVLAGGYLSDSYLIARAINVGIFGLGIATIFMVPFQLVAYLYDGTTAAIASLCIVAIMGSVYLGPSFAMTQALVSLRMRAVACYFALCSEPYWYGLGPVLCRHFSDVFAPTFGIDSLRYALCIAVLVNLGLACITCWCPQRAGRPAGNRGDERKAGLKQ